MPAWSSVRGTFRLENPHSTALPPALVTITISHECGIGELEVLHRAVHGDLVFELSNIAAEWWAFVSVRVISSTMASATVVVRTLTWLLDVF